MLSLLSLSLVLCVPDDAFGSAAGGNSEVAEAPFNPATRIAEVGVAVQGELLGRGLAFDGVRVLSVRPGSAAARAGLRPNDKIYGVNGHNLDIGGHPFPHEFLEGKLGWLLKRRGRVVLDVERERVGSIKVNLLLPWAVDYVIEPEPRRRPPVPYFPNQK